MRMSFLAIRLVALVVDVAQHLISDSLVRGRTFLPVSARATIREAQDNGWEPGLISYPPRCILYTTVFTASIAQKRTSLNKLLDFIGNNPRLLVITGAGLSAQSGIPTYRDDAGTWQHSEPIQHQDFLAKPRVRKHYWARSMIGWRYIEQALPNPAHFALAELEHAGHITLLATQNVDRLHQRAGHQQVVDLHGRVDRVVCLDCGSKTARSDLQRILKLLNPGLSGRAIRPLPDGDADLPQDRVHDFVVPDCTACGGTLMPDVVFYGGSVPRQRVAQISEALEQADGLLAAGSSLMVFSAYRFCKLAAETGKPLAILNRGRTRADELAGLKIGGDCARELTALCDALQTS